jgi:hypothetical protein
MIDRAQNLYVNTQTATVLLDESESNGIADAAANAEFDNSLSGFVSVRDADDYEATRDALTSDGRWTASGIRYNALTAFNQFFIGPRVSWQANHGIMVTAPVVMVASYGLNHLGQPLTTAGVEGGKVYATSYNYAAGAIFSSMESYNCRDFGGLGTLSFAQQQQAATEDGHQAPQRRPQHRPGTAAALVAGPSSAPRPAAAPGKPGGVAMGPAPPASTGSLAADAVPARCQRAAGAAAA